MARTRALAQDYIEALKHLGYEFRMNECNDDLEVNRLPITDSIRSTLRSEMYDKGYRQAHVMEDAYTAYAYKHRYHPVKEYLWGLKHDGKDYISEVASCFEDKYNVFGLWFRKWLIGACMRACDDGVQNPMLVLDGGQGIGKSSFVYWLASELPDYFLESAIHPTDKDDFIRLVATWIWEVGELGRTTRQVDREELKDFISRKKVSVRKAYGRYDIRKPALASFIGTVNNEGGILSDPTGNRRFLICTVTKLSWAYSDIPVGQLWAQAMELYKAGETNSLTDTEKMQSESINEEYEIDDPVAGMLEKYFQIDNTKSDWWMPTTDILETLTHKGLQGNTKSNSMALSVAATRLNLVKSKRWSTNGRRVNGYEGICCPSEDDKDDISMALGE